MKSKYWKENLEEKQKVKGQMTFILEPWNNEAVYEL